VEALDVGTALDQWHDTVGNLRMVFARQLDTEACEGEVQELEALNSGDDPVIILEGDTLGLRASCRGWRARWRTL
jgi:hypothetical protein